ncbi:hypothetical protein LTR70_000124 [Exophiala xenobiotica]|uniref:Uncharacterized protein n=1 Tax=Lithohypha guttulata TaxID=1690604 RepID=A0ABR0KPF1_9EURO|nr:hypothetical protein LTR24_000249 [Lithohypha guttulata]KAK5330802.1 hypothetical protein LTR70_000124 [Exophiala xenobiotica]
MLEAAGTADDPSRIIVVSSIAGTHVTHTGNNGTIMYSVSKAAAHHLTRNLAIELGPRNITTNTVAPGFFPSKLANGLIEILGGEEALKKANPRKRLGIPDDIAAVMLFLTGPAASYINGVDIPVDGGNRLVEGSLAKL